MKTKLLTCIILSLAWGLKSAPLPPADSFRLTVNEVVNSGHCRVLTLKIEGRTNAEMMELRFLEGQGGGSCQLGWTLKGKGREGEMVLAAMQTHPESAVETTAVLQGGGGQASLPASYELPSKAEARSVFSLTVTNGLYELNRPLVIGKRNGEPMRLVVGRWNWEKIAQRK